MLTHTNISPILIRTPPPFPPPPTPPPPPPPPRLFFFLFFLWVVLSVSFSVFLLFFFGVCLFFFLSFCVLLFFVYSPSVQSLFFHMFRHNFPEPNHFPRGFLIPNKSPIFSPVLPLYSLRPTYPEPPHLP